MWRCRFWMIYFTNLSGRYWKRCHWSKKGKKSCQICNFTDAQTYRQTSNRWTETVCTQEKSVRVKKFKQIPCNSDFLNHPVLETCRLTCIKSYFTFLSQTRNVPPISQTCNQFLFPLEVQKNQDSFVLVRASDASGV